MSGPKMGLGRVDREGETASRFSHSLPGPLSPFPELPYRDIGTPTVDLGWIGCCEGEVIAIVSDVTTHMITIPFCGLCEPY